MQSVQLQDHDELTIVFCEVPLKFGSLDNMIWQKDVSHSYLALVKKDDGTVISEIHGTSYDKRLDRLAGGVAGSAVALIGVGVEQLRQHHVFNRMAHGLGLDDHLIRLRVSVTQGRHRFEQNHARKDILCAPAEEVIPLWHRLVEASIEINKADLPYTPFGSRKNPGQNCHSVCSDLLEIIGAEHPNCDFYARPGYIRALCDKIPLLKSFKDGSLPVVARNCLVTLQETVLDAQSSVKHAQKPKAADLNPLTQFKKLKEKVFGQVQQS